jgi:hypothetical protein
MAVVLISGERLLAALNAANSAVERGEKISARLNHSLSLIRERRDELAAKVAQTTAEQPQEMPDWLML